jgi:cytochrome c oxidase subunit II
MPLLHALSQQADAMRFDWWVFTVAGLAVFVFVIGLVLYAAIRWRDRGQVPEMFSNNTPWELASVVLPIVIVTALFVVSQRQEDAVDALAASPQSRVDVTAYRWSWTFSYDGTPVTVYGTPNAPPTLLLPLGRTTEISLRSNDVTHSFWVPALLFKRDAIPGLVNRFDVTPLQVGRFAAKCAQFCGLNHAFMTFTVQVVPGSVFNRYLASGGAHVP